MVSRSQRLRRSRDTCEYEDDYSPKRPTDWPRRLTGWPRAFSCNHTLNVVAPDATTSRSDRDRSPAKHEVRMSDEADSRSDATLESVAGKWHLVDLAADETHIPHHRVDLIFHADADRLRGAILTRASGHEIPLASVQFDGDVLRLQMTAAKDMDQADM